MAVDKHILNISLRARVLAGYDQSGKPISKFRSFTNVNDISPEDALEVLQALMSLQKYPVQEYLQVDTSFLSEQGE